MSTTTSVLRQAQSWTESCLPDFVQPLQRPIRMGRATQLAFLRWEKRSLDATERFWQDFGLTLVGRTQERVWARGTGRSPCIAWACKGSRNQFLGPAFVLSDDSSLQSYVDHEGAQWLDPQDIPGGGQGVALKDPSGRSVWLLQGQHPVSALAQREPLTLQTNDAKQTRRINRMVRTPLAPAQVLRLGHFVLQTVDFPAMTKWYMRILGLIPTDVQYLSDGSSALCFFRLDLGQTPADHHTVVIVGGIEDKYEHSAYEVTDLDALGQGQQVLRAQGHRHMWGIGRHLLGSQLFDYWYDPDGFEYEHYTDGDLFTADFETQYSPMDFGGIWAWGPDAPESMKPAKNLRNGLRILELLIRKKTSGARLKLMNEALSAPARPWL
jgi:catechol 2,3-dioxygenase-like lactoylglutathione lyase family enzyme